MFNINQIYVLNIASEHIYINSDEANSIYKIIMESSVKSVMIRGSILVNLSFYSSIIPLSESKVGSHLTSDEKSEINKKILKQNNTLSIANKIIGKLKGKNE